MNEPLTSRDRVRQPHPECGDSMTEQHHEKACNINSIMAKYQKTGLIDHVKTYEGVYGDVTGADFKTAQDLVAQQKTIFNELPASVRAEFDHDVANYLDLMVQEDGLEQLRDYLTDKKDEKTDNNDPPESTSDGTKKDGKTLDSDEAAVT